MRKNRLKNTLIGIVLLVLFAILILIGLRPNEVRAYFEKFQAWLASFKKNKVLDPQKNSPVAGTGNSFAGAKNYTESDGQKAILAVKQRYGLDLARTVERMFRLETSHFKSAQFRLTGTPGMEKGKWPANEVPSNLPTIQMNDADLTDGIDTFIVWNPTDCALFLARYIQRYGGNFARWNTTDEKKQVAYRQSVNSIKNRFV